MQLVPAIADAGRAARRSTSAARSGRDRSRAITTRSPAGSQWLFEHLPFYAAWFRFTMLWRYGDGLLPFLRKDPDWPHPERSLNRINDRHREEMTDHIVSELAGGPT